MTFQLDTISISQAWPRQTWTYFDGVGLAILVYDYFLTLPRETSLIWPTPWNSMKVLFLLTRYLPFVDGVLHIIGLRGPGAHSCLAIFKARSWMQWTGLVFPEVILTLRTWAVWDRNRLLGIGLTIFFAACWVPSIAVKVLFLNAVEILPLSGLPMSGCAATALGLLGRICWIILLVYDAGLCFLMLIRAVGWFKDGCGSKFVLAVFRNGLLYYVVLLTISTVNVFLTPKWRQAILLAQRFIHSIIACRVILDIRAQALDLDTSVVDSSMLDTSLHMSASFAVGTGMDDSQEVIYQATGADKGKGKAPLRPGYQTERRNVQHRVTLDFSDNLDLTN